MAARIKAAPVIAFLLTILLIALPEAVSAAPLASAADKKILLLHSYHAGLSWTDRITAAILEKLKATGATEIFVEYLDSKRNPSGSSPEAFTRYITGKYASMPLDLVIAIDNDALDFVREEKSDLFSSVPKVFCGINNFDPAMLKGVKNITGVVERTSPLRTAQLAVRLRPDTRRIIFVCDDTVTGLAEVEHAKKELEDFRSMPAVEWWVGYDHKKLLADLNGLSSNDAVILILFNRDRSGVFFAYEESARLVAKASPAPVYGLWDFYMDNGVVGGCMASAWHQGETAAMLASRILDGEKTSNIMLVDQSPNRYIFDHRQLDRFNISEALLPEGAMILNREPGWWEANRRVFLVVALIALLEALLIIFVLCRRKKNEADVLEQKIFNKKNLAESASMLKAFLESTADGIVITDKKGIVSAFNQKYLQIWKIPEKMIQEENRQENKQAIMRHCLALIKANDVFAEAIKKAWENIETTVSGTVEFLDGRFVEYYSQPRWLDDHPEGRVWSFRDITEKKLAENELLAVTRHLEENMLYASEMAT
jgi:PAS domain-containing protein